MKIKDLFKKRTPKKPYEVLISDGSVSDNPSRFSIIKKFRTAERALKYAVNYARGHKLHPRYLKTKYYVKKYGINFINLLTRVDGWEQKFTSDTQLHLRYLNTDKYLIDIRLQPKKLYLKYFKNLE